MKVIENNPYRYLGVYSNSPTKERVAHQGKMNAFLKVGKPVSFPLDLPNLLPAIERTEANVADAVSKLTLPTDQLKYAQFWWMKATDIDSIAFNHLLSGNIDVARSVWEKKDDASSLQNRIVLALIQQDYATAISCAENLYNNHASSFATAIAASGTATDGTALAHSFLDVLMDEGLDMMKLQVHVFDSGWRAYVAEKVITPLIDSITQAVAAAQASRGKGPEARYKAGQKLMTSTKSALSKLKSLLSTTDIRYTTTVDKLGEEILQCGIDYYNNSQDDDNAEKAMVLQSYALSIVVGSMAKQRCQQNVDILKKIISELPPAEVRKEYNLIMDELRKYSKLPDRITYAINLLNNTKPQLQTMRTKLGSNNPQYLKISTRIVSNALHNVIEEVNAAQDQASRLPGLYISDLKDTLREAWKATLLMDKFDIESEFQARFNINRNTLKGLCGQLGVPTPSGSATPHSGASHGPTPPPSQQSSGGGGSGCFEEIMEEFGGCLLKIGAWIIVVLIISGLASMCG